MNIMKVVYEIMDRGVVFCYCIVENNIDRYITELSMDKNSIPENVIRLDVRDFISMKIGG